ncbi:hypothetical protein BVRB_9g209900 [Beta vulgaris subsp. vulgaris]|nr:hypothetical protein BVRB_9g209900 [Beta vulgaris subsp. vulgaris]
MEERCQFYERMRGSIVCIKDDRGRLIGGGVFVKVGSRQLVLTAAHVVYKKKHLRIVCCDKKSYVVHLRHLDRKRDVGLLDVSKKPNGGFECAQLCENNELVRTTEIHFIGHSGRLKFTYNIGNISCVDRTCGDIYKTEFALDIFPSFPRAFYEELIDDFRGLDGSVRLVQAKNVHGGGRLVVQGRHSWIVMGI